MPLPFQLVRIPQVPLEIVFLVTSLKAPVPPISVEVYELRRSCGGVFGSTGPAASTPLLEIPITVHLFRTPSTVTGWRARGVVLTSVLEGEDARFIPSGCARLCCISMLPGRVLGAVSRSCEAAFRAENTVLEFCTVAEVGALVVLITGGLTVTRLWSPAVWNFTHHRPVGAAAVCRGVDFPEQGITDRITVLPVLPVGRVAPDGLRAGGVPAVAAFETRARVLLRRVPVPAGILGDPLLAALAAPRLRLAPAIANALGSERLVAALGWSYWQRVAPVPCPLGGRVAPDGMCATGVPAVVALETGLRVRSWLVLVSAGRLHGPLLAG